MPWLSCCYLDTSEAFAEGDMPACRILYHTWR